MTAFFDKLKQKFKNLLKDKVVIIKKTIIIDGHNVTDVEKDLDPETARRVSQKMDKMFDDFGKSMDETFDLMDKQMNDIFSEFDKKK